MLGRLLDPKGLLSLSLPSSAIAAVNHEVLEETSEGSKKRGVRTVQAILRRNVTRSVVMLVSTAKQHADNLECNRRVRTLSVAYSKCG